MNDPTINSFWDEYLDSDYFKRKELIKSLPFFKDLEKMLSKVKTNNKNSLAVYEYVIRSAFSGYLEDLIFVMESKKGSVNEGDINTSQSDS